MWNFKASNFEIREDIFHFGTMSDKKILRIGFHKTFYFFRFQGIANIPSCVFHTFCLIYPALSDQTFLSIGFHMSCHICRFQGIEKIPSYVFHTFCLIFPALSEDLYFFEKINSQNFIHCTDPVLRPGLKPQVKTHFLLTYTVVLV